MKKIRVGLDFDGVVAYNPFRIIRAPVSFVKRKLLGKRSLKFFIPKNKWQELLLMLLHESSQIPGAGLDKVGELKKSGQYEFYLITARFGFLERGLYKWLARHKLNEVFEKISVNSRNEQPHEYKERMIKEYRLEFFVEDNFDIVHYLQGRTQAKIYWVFNVLDRGQEYPYKVASVGQALEEIAR